MSKSTRILSGWALALVAALIGVLLLPAAPAAAAPGDVLYRLNAGGAQLPALDGGPAWAADSTTYRVNSGSNTTFASSATPDSSVPAVTPVGIWQSERYDTTSTMQYAFPVQAGLRVEVRLYVANGWVGTSQPGQRVYDISIDGSVPAALDDIDLAGDFGHQVGHMLAVPVTSDGTVNIGFAASIQNPLINAIEIVEAGPEPGTLTAAPSSVSFGEVLVGAAAATETVTLTNAGATGAPAITIDSVTLTSGTPFTAGVPSSTSVAAGASATVNVAYEPTAAGDHSAVLTVEYSSTAGSGVLEVDLAGTAADPTPIEDALTAAPTSIDFPVTAVDGGSANAAVELTNAGAVGEADVAITGVTVDDSQFTSGPAPAAPIGPGESVSVPFTFDPDAEGAQSATATVEYERGSETGTLEIALSGEGTSVTPPAENVVYRVNVGGPQVSAADGSSPAWSADTAGSPSSFRTLGGGSFYGLGSGQAYPGPIVMSHSSVPASAPAAVFETERWDAAGGDEMTWAFPVTAGSTYEVRLLFAELYSGVSSAGTRFFDVALEGAVPAAFDNIDAYATAGAAGAMARSATYTASDSTLNLTFVHVNENPALKGIEIIDTTSHAGVLMATPDVLSFGSVDVDQTSAPQSVQLANLGAAGDPAITILSVAATGDLAVDPDLAGTAIAAGAAASLGVTFAPTVAGSVEETVTVTYQGSGGPQSLTVAVTGTGTVPPFVGEALYRLNTGGGQLAALDDGIPWGADTNTANAAQLINAGSNTTFTSSATPDISVPATTPLGIWQSERYDTTGAMAYGFPVPAGTRVEVHLFVANGWGGTSQAGQRVFDIAIDGQVPDELDDIDLSGQFGHQVGHMYAIPVTSDGTVNITFDASVENPLINAIEIVEAGPESGTLAANRVAVDLGEVVLGSSATDTVVATNAGASGDPDVTIDSVSVAPGTQFSAATPSATTLAPGESASIDVTYEPTETGPSAAVLTVAYSSSAGSGQLEIDLSGVGGDATPLADALVADPATVEFANTVVSGATATESTELTNAGAVGEAAIDITGITVDDPQFVVGALPTDALAAGQSAQVEFTFDPASVGPQSAIATVEFERAGEVGTMEISLEGVGVEALSIDNLSWNQSTLAGEVSQSATTLDWGPDGRLYVTQFDGTVYAYTIGRVQGSNYSVPGTYQVTDIEEIDLIQEIPNHNDQGVAQPDLTGRIALGIIVEGTAENPVVYVTSNHPTLNGGSVIDTNSGTLSRLTWTGTEWEHEVLIAGLPRSQHDHMLGGIQIDEDANVAYINTGGNTNQGARSNNMDQLPETALSAAILSIDLDVIDAMPTTTVDGVDYKYILPTIESGPNPAPGTMPWGGKAGANQALLVQGGPITIHSPGYRNAYDLVLAENGNLFTVDNGPNGGWGHAPSASYVDGDTNGIGDATWANGKCVDSSFAGGGSTKPDQLHRANLGDYGGHPNVTRANPLGLPNGAENFGAAIPGGWYANEQECQYLPAGEDTGLTTFDSSTNGITEYTSSQAFGGALKGALLTASYTGNGEIWAMIPSDDGTYLETTKVPLFSGFGAGPLDVAAQGDDGEFPGLVAAVAYSQAASIIVWEPQGGAVCDTSNGAADNDGDGYTNADEIASGTGPCNNGSRPYDADGDLIGDVTDTDDDNDGLADVLDPFQVDPANGAGVSEVQLDFAATENQGGFEGAGLTGVMLNATGKGAGAGDDYLDLLNRRDVIWGGTSPLLQVNQVKEGDALGTTNTQEDGLQVAVDGAGAPFRAETTIVNPAFASTAPEFASVAQNSASQGIYIGDGTQSNYLKLALAYENGIVMRAIKEVDDAVVTDAQVSLPGAANAQYVDLMLDVTPGATEATVVPSYAIDGAAAVTMPAMTVPMSWFDGPSYLEPSDPPSKLAVGIIATSAGTAAPFDAAWTGLTVVQTDPPVETPMAQARIAVTPGAGINASTYGDNTIQITNQSDPGVLIESVEFDLSTALLPDLVFDPGDSSVAGDLVTVCFVPTTGAAATGLTTQLSGGQNCGPDGTPSLSDAFLAPYQSGFQGLRMTFDDFDEADDGAAGYAFGFKVDIDPTSIQGTPSPGPGESGSVSGLELTGSTVTVAFSNGETHVATLFQDGSLGGALAVAKAGSAAAPTLSVNGVGAGPANVASAAQTLTLTGTAGAAYEILRVEGAMFQQSGGGIDVDAFESNSVIGVQVLSGTLTGGSVQVPVTLTDTNASGGINSLVAVIRDADGDTGATSNVVVLQLP